MYVVKVVLDRRQVANVLLCLCLAVLASLLVCGGREGGSGAEQGMLSSIQIRRNTAGMYLGMVR